MSDDGEEEAVVQVVEDTEDVGGFADADLGEEEEEAAPEDTMDTVPAFTTLSRMTPDLGTLGGKLATSGGSTASLKRKTAPVDTDDLAELEDLTDTILCECLDARFKADLIYTYVGNILIAVNPFAWLQLYTDNVSAKYTNIHNKTDQPPHLFAIADSAFHSMVRNKKAQVCVISGESGAGKTESAKQFVRQIMDVSARGLMGGAIADEAADAPARARHPVEGKILQQNPILEAFGNAQTVMNDNSSRFGKFIELKFSTNDLVCGAEMSHYLLEKSRIILQGPGERNFHIFSLMFSGMDQTARDAYRLTDYEDYRYLQDGPGNDAKQKAEWTELQEAFVAINFYPTEIDQLQSAVAAVLMIGQIDFVDSSDGDAAMIENSFMLENVCHVLGVAVAAMSEGLMTSVINMRGEIITKKLNIKKCNNGKNAVAKALYDRLFRWLVFKVNMTLMPSDDDKLADVSIGILDIFGFENFKKNGFDQMCINLANEQLHYFFNQHIFAAEIGSYADEGLEISADVMFSDNMKIIDMFFRNKPVGLLALLDEESSLERSTAESLLNKFNKNLAEEPLYCQVKGNYAFEVIHYAGQIRYNTEGFLEKNTDPLPNMIQSVMRSSTSIVISTIFTDDFDVRLVSEMSRQKSIFGGGKTGMFRTRTVKGHGKSKRVVEETKIERRSSKLGKELDASGPAKGGKAKPKGKAEAQTVSNAFRKSLALLMEKMGMCEPHFVRCIKPNPQKQPKLWDLELVMRQLTYTGMLQTVQMRREGYPFRIAFDEFWTAYHGIVFDFSHPGKGTAATCTELLTKLEEHVEEVRKIQGSTTITTTLRGWKVARTKVFLKYWQVDLLEGMAYPFGVSAIKIQKTFRGFFARKKYKVLHQKYLDQCATARSFLDDVSGRSGRIHGYVENIIDEETRKGPVGLGIAKPVVKKEEKKAAKKEGEVQVNVASFEKDLDKVKKKVVKWWLKFERKKGCHVDEEGSVHPWFHGLISRVEAEDYLFDQENGAFLIRISERTNGYALSFKHRQRIRHYKLGFSKNGGYEITGNDEEFGDIAEMVEYFKEHAITPGEDDILVEAVQYEHDLGLGIAQNDAVAGKRPNALTKSARAKKVNTMMVMDDDASGAPIPASAYLKDPENPPAYVRGNVSRDQAETELRERGMADGRFMVREKKRTSERIVFALSVVFRSKFYHHLLTKQLEGDWQLDEKSLNFSADLEEVIESLQTKRSSRLAGMLEREGFTTAEDSNLTRTRDPASPARKASLHGASPQKSLVPGDSSTVDDVVAWLASLGMARYAGAIYKGKFDGKKLHTANEKALRKIIKQEDDYRLVVRALR
jgi:hypothetical protein